MWCCFAVPSLFLPLMATSSSKLICHHSAYFFRYPVILLDLLLLVIPKKSEVPNEIKVKWNYHVQSITKVQLLGVHAWLVASRHHLMPHQVSMSLWMASCIDITMLLLHAVRPFKCWDHSLGLRPRRLKNRTMAAPLRRHSTAHVYISACISNFSTSWFMLVPLRLVNKKYKIKIPQSIWSGNKL